VAHLYGPEVNSMGGKSEYAGKITGAYLIDRTVSAAEVILELTGQGFSRLRLILLQKL